MFPIATNKFCSLVMNGLADVDRFKICIEVGVRLGFPALKLYCAGPCTLPVCVRTTCAGPVSPPPTHRHVN